MMFTNIKRRISALEQLASKRRDPMTEQLQLAAFDAMDLINIEHLIKFLERGGRTSDASLDERIALLDYMEKYQAAAVQLYRRPWRVLVRAGVVCQHE